MRIEKYLVAPEGRMTIISDPVVRVLDVASQRNSIVMFCEVADPEDEEFAAARESDLFCVALGTNWDYPTIDWTKDYTYYGSVETDDEWHVFARSGPKVVFE